MMDKMDTGLSRPSGQRSRWLAALWLGACCVLALVLNQGQAASPVTIGGGTSRGFHVEDFYRGIQGQKDKKKLDFWGAEADLSAFTSSNVPLKGIRLQFYSLDGKTNVVIEAADCIYNASLDIAFSSNRLQVTSGGGELTLEGRGFLWRKAADILIISNDTRAALQPTSTAAKDQRLQSVVITSEGAEFNQGARQVRFWNQVHAQEPAMDITCEGLLFKLRDTSVAMDKVSTENRIEQILAETNVVVRLADQQIEARSDRAEYHWEQGRERMELLGHPVCTQAGREVQADHISLERAARVFIAQGNAVAKLPGTDMINSPDLFQAITQATNRAPATAKTNETIVVRAEEMRFWTNGVVMQGAVRATQPSDSGDPAQLHCGLLTITNSAPTTKLDLITLIDDVLVQQGKTNIHSSRLVYNKTRQNAKFSGKTEWSLGAQSGAADAIQFDLAHREMAARTNAMLFLNLDKSAGALLPTFAATNTAAASQPRSLKILSGQYDAGPGQIIFRDSIKATEFAGDAPQGTLGCELLIVKLATNGVAKTGTNHMQIESILAETNVQFEAVPTGTNAAKFKKLTCDRLVGEIANGAPLRLTGEGKVQFQFDKGTVYGDQIEYNVLEKKAKLTGNVHADALQGSATFPYLIIDVDTGIILTPKLKFVNQAGKATNTPAATIAP